MLPPCGLLNALLFLSALIVLIAPLLLGVLVILRAFIVCYLISGGYVRLLYRKLPVVAFTGLPMASPDTRSSTLRFCCRPAELSLEATGKVLPKPRDETEFVDTPSRTR